MPLETGLLTPSENGHANQFGSISETTVIGLPRRRMNASSLRVTRKLDGGVSVINVRHSRLQS